MDLTPDLKVACYELQMHKIDEDALDDIRTCSQCIEDMLQVVCGSTAEYPYHKKPKPKKMTAQSS